MAVVAKLHMAHCQHYVCSCHHGLTSGFHCRTELFPHYTIASTSGICYERLKKRCSSETVLRRCCTSNFPIVFSYFSLWLGCNKELTNNIPIYNTDAILPLSIVCSLLHPSPFSSQYLIHKHNRDFMRNYFPSVLWYLLPLPLSADRCSHHTLN